MDSARSMATLQRLRGHETRIALTGSAALTAATEFLPEIVLLDIGLPGLDGYEVAARMRKLRHDPRPTLIALTGYGGAANVDRALKAGFDHHVVKPVGLDAVLRLVDEAMRAEDWTGSDHVLPTGHGSLPDEDWQPSRPAPLASDQDGFDSGRIA